MAGGGALSPPEEELLPAASRSQPPREVLSNYTKLGEQFRMVSKHCNFLFFFSGGAVQDGEQTLQFSLFFSGGAVQDGEQTLQFSFFWGSSSGW